MSRFTDTMPAVYARLYRAAEIAEHTAIAERRGGRLVHAEMWQSAKGPLLCLIAEDRPGLLAFVTDALLAQGMAIQSARAFCRELGKDQFEAVDFLELRALDGPPDVAAELDAGGLAAFSEVLSDVIAEDLEHRSSGSGTARPSDGFPRTRVYFERETLADGHYLLVVDAPDSTGLLHAVSSALHERSMRITACEIRTLEGRASDRFEVESSSGNALSDSQLCDVQLAVLAALPVRK